MSTTIIIGPVRTSFCHLWEPKAPKGSDKATYSVQLVFDEDGPIAKQIEAAIEEAREEGGKKLEGVKASKLRNPLYDGETEFPGDDFYKGKKYVNASNTRQPGIAKKVKGEVVTITDEEEVYSGCWVYAELNFFAYNNVGAGIGVSLQNVLKAKDGERLDGRRSAETTFAGVDFGDTEEDDAPPTSIKASTSKKKEDKEVKTDKKIKEEKKKVEVEEDEENPFD
jgi:hypothetical protein